jgi:hypothetical protein
MRSETLELEETVEQLRRRIGWQVATAYGLPLEEPRAPEPVLPPPVAASVAAPVAAAPAAVPPKPSHSDELPVPSLEELERLVATAAAAQPDRAEEWWWYLFYLRQFAGVDGSLPSTFRVLVDTVFGSLLSAEGMQIRVQ